MPVTQAATPPRRMRQTVCPAQGAVKLHEVRHA